MNPAADTEPAAGDDEAAYSLEAIAELTGLPSRTILHYREAGLITAAGGSGPGESRFDDEALRTLRRIEHLTATCGMNTAGLRLLLSLTKELERLRDELRRRG
jgi:DNA-binding transcriptional MerR regulator